MRYIWILLLLFGILDAKTTYKDALFASIANVPKGDVLNFRKKPDYRSKKVGSLPYNDNHILGVQKCIKKDKSIWCKVQVLMPFDLYEYDMSEPGWVNAKYLNFGGEGYTLIDDKAGCFYSLDCENGYCEIIDDVIYYSPIIVIKSTKKIKRSRLFPTNQFDVEEGGDGYCTTHAYLTYDDSPMWTIAYLLEDLKTDNIKNLISLIHPQKGVVLTDHVSFGVTDVTLTKDEFEKYVKINKKILEKFQNGKDEEKSLIGVKDFLNSLHRSFDDPIYIDETKKCNGFVKTKDTKCFKISWKDIDVPQDYLNMIVVLQKYRNKWYIVGLLRERWTI